MAGAPELVALVGGRRPLQLAAAVAGGDLAHRLHLLGDRLRPAVELEEQRVGLGLGQLVVGVDRADRGRVQQLAARHRDPQLDRLGDRGDRAVEAVEDAAGGGDLLRDAVDAQRQLGDHRERALRAEQQPREVVAGRGLAGARAGLDHGPVGEHRLQAEHVLAHRPVARRAGARGGGGGHAAERRVGAGVDREEEAVLPEPLLEREPVHAGLDAAVEVLGVDLEHPVHPGEVERHAAVDGQHVALERAAGAERDHRHAVLASRSAGSPRPPRWCARRRRRRARAGRSATRRGRAARAPRARSRSGRRAGRAARPRPPRSSGRGFQLGHHVGAGHGPEVADGDDPRPQRRQPADALARGVRVQVVGLVRDVGGRRPAASSSSGRRCR